MYVYPITTVDSVSVQLEQLQVVRNASGFVRYMKTKDPTCQANALALTARAGCPLPHRRVVALGKAQNHLVQPRVLGRGNHLLRIHLAQAGDVFGAIVPSNSSMSWGKYQYRPPTHRGSHPWIGRSSSNHLPPPSAAKSPKCTAPAPVCPTPRAPTPLSPKRAAPADSPFKIGSLRSGTTATTSRSVNAPVGGTRVSAGSRSGFSRSSASRRANALGQRHPPPGPHQQINRGQRPRHQHVGSNHRPR